MALFSRSTQTEKKTLETPAVSSRARDLSWVLIDPRVTEKATDVNTARAYVFNVASSANKAQIAAAVREAYSVTPVKVRVATIRAKSVRNARTGKLGTKSGGKKAYVYLKEGDSITIM